MEISTIVFDFISLMAILWTIVQHFQIRRKVSQENLLNLQDLQELQTVMDKFEADIRQMKAEHTTSTMELWEFIDKTLDPIKKRLAVRATRDKQDEESQQPRKGGIIPYPNGTNKQG